MTATTEKAQRRPTHRWALFIPAALAAGAIGVLVFQSTGRSAAADAAIDLSDVYATPALEAGTVAIYFTVTNPAEADEITSVSTDAGGSASFFRSSDDGDMSTMGAVDRVTVPARSTVALEPGGLHVMAGPATVALVPGREIRVTLTFANAPAMTFTAPVRSFADIAATQDGTGDER